jgi:two-component system response regulator HydG
LSDAFLKRAADARGESPRVLAPDALEAMQRYSWPGNVRELENALERAAILAKGDTIPLSALPDRVVEPKLDPLVSDAVQANPTLDTIERAYILWVLENEGGNKPRTAEVLGIDPSTLYRKLSRYGLPT